MLEFQKIGEYFDKIIEQEEEEMGVKFDHCIKNIEAIDVITDFEMLPDEVKLQVRTKEDVHLFHLEGEGVKFAADRYTELKAENFRLKKERDELKAAINDIRASNKELERIQENFIKKNKYLIDKLGVKDTECVQLNTKIDKLEKRNKELNKQIDEMVLNANKKKEEDAGNTDQSYSLDSVVKALDKALDGFSERMDKLIKEFDDIFYEGELEVTTEETYEVKEADEEPSSRRDILRCAEKCVCGKREQDYGTPESNFKLIADLWNGYLGGRTDNPVISITPLDVAMMMALLKIARIRNGGGTGDSFVDLAGYAACGGEINAQKKATETN